MVWAKVRAQPPQISTLFVSSGEKKEGRCQPSLYGTRGGAPAELSIWSRDRRQSRMWTKVEVRVCWGLDWSICFGRLLSSSLIVRRARTQDLRNLSREENVMSRTWDACDIHTCILHTAGITWKQRAGVNDVGILSPRGIQYFSPDLLA